MPKLLPGKMHVSAHRYPKNGYLLCHDDDIMASAGISRRIAFILYLVEEDWSDEKDGGSLLLYQKPDGSENSTWTTPVKITPSFGSFAFFKVGQDSLHCVDEVIGNRERVSIRYAKIQAPFPDSRSSGWLYGPSDPQSCSQTFTKPLAELPLVHSLADPPCLEQMINPIYLSESSIASIQSHFIDNSAIDLYSFLNPETYKSLVQACDEAQWTLSRAGPPTLQWFASPDTQHPTPRIMQSVSQLLTCPAFIQLLERMTSLPLQAHTQDVSCLARRFTEKCYTMLKDPAESAALSVVLDAACPNGPLDGGQAVYVYGEDTLLCTERRGNALRVVLMDPGVHAFTRYVRAGSSGGLVEFRVHGIRGLDLDGDNE